VDTNSLKPISTIAPDFDLNTTKLSISKLLRLVEATVTFTKKDGTERVMRCTLKEGVVVPHERKTDRIKEPKDDILPVWDIDAQAWRSINVPNILSIEVVG